MNVSKSKFKIFIRSAFDRLALWSGILHYYEKKMCSGLTILMYHRILPAEQCTAYPLDSLIIPAKIFKAQVEHLAESCTVLPVCDAIKELCGGAIFPKPLVAITFDDGYLDNYEVAAPILESVGLKGTFFVTSEFVKKGLPLWHDRAAVLWEKSGEQVDISIWMENLKKLPPVKRMEKINRLESVLDNSLDYSNYKPMTISQVKDLHKRGHEVASHSVSHSILTQLSDEELNSELISSAEDIKSWIGCEVTGFCYPNGNYDQNIETVLERTGYTYACTIEEGVNRNVYSLYRLFRIPITMRRTMVHNRHDTLGFRLEICRLRSLLREYVVK